MNLKLQFNKEQGIKNQPCFLGGGRGIAEPTRQRIINPTLVKMTFIGDLL